MSQELRAYLSDFAYFFDSMKIDILSKVHIPDNFESYNSLTLSFTNIGGLHFNIVGYESFLESNFQNQN